MSTAGNYHLEIQKKLGLCCAGNPDSICIAEATLDTWHRMAALLAPVIGSKGVDVLFSRALHLTGAAFPWLPNAGDHESSLALLADLKKHLADHEAGVAAEASCALLVNFIELLATLIGEALTERLLAPAWTPPLAVSEQEYES